MFNALARWHQPIQSISAIASVLALIGGGIYAIYQYDTKVKEDRVREVFTFLAKRDQPSLLNARRSVEASFNKAFEQIKVIGNEPKSEDRDKRYCELVRGIIESNSLHGEFESIVEFYDTLDVCITTELCDSATARSFFQQDATRFSHAFFCYVQFRREDSKDSEYARGLDRIASLK